jgi:4-alpha-glucanotransferase
VTAAGDPEAYAAAQRHHLYCQWAAQRQMSDLDARARARGLGLYLDFPLGAHPAGFDVWREREAFARGVHVGAPPDAFFTRGQDWGFPPAHPERSRAQGHRYFRAALRHAGVLRLDHVMGLHRLFWVPQGAPARDGVYVRFPAPELYAILSLESHRSRTLLVGENLGTVPGAVDAALARRGVRGMYVLQYAASPDPERTPEPVPPGAIAGLNTHDTPPFRAFWEARDVDDQLDLGLVSPAGAAAARARRRAVRLALARVLTRQGLLNGDPDDPRAVLSAALAWLARGPAGGVLVNLEDLWLETLPQNVPGTRRERPHWQRPARLARKAFTRLPEVLAAPRRRRPPDGRRGADDGHPGAGVRVRLGGGAAPTSAPSSSPAPATPEAGAPTAARRRRGSRAHPARASIFSTPPGAQPAELPAVIGSDAGGSPDEAVRLALAALRGRDSGGQDVVRR